MNARMKLMAREHVALFVVTTGKAGESPTLAAREVDPLAKETQTHAAALTIAHSLCSLDVGQAQSTRETEPGCCLRLAGPPEHQFRRM